MKISQFCKTLDVPLTTVRYYIHEGILVPYKKNTQYTFSDSDVYEMKMILKLKKLCFSTDEIKRFLQVLRFYNMDDEEINKQLSSIYYGKKQHLEEEIRKYRETIAILDKEIKQCSGKSRPADYVGGIPLTFSPYLACPKCGGLFDLSQVQIRNNQIYKGTIQCGCSYSAEIEDGIIMTIPPSDYYTSQEFYVMHYREQHLDPDSDFVFFQYMHDISSEAAALIHKAYNWIDTTICSHKPNNKVILIPDLASHYLYKNINSPYFKDAYIIVTGFSKQTIKSIKSHIDHLAPDLQIIYIANTIYELPIRKNIINLWIDAISSYNFSFFHDYPLQEKVDEYMSDDARVVGFTKYHDNKKTESLKNIREMFPYALPDNSLLSTFQQTMKNTGWNLILQEDLGHALDPGEYYDYHKKGERHNFHGFYGKK